MVARDVMSERDEDDWWNAYIAKMKRMWSLPDIKRSWAWLRRS